MHSNVDSSERQLSIQVQLNDFHSQVQKQSSDAMKQLTSLRNDILEAEPAEAPGNIGETTKEARFQATSRFLKWLRSGNRLFHISGKAGSGKSTLMKLLLDHEKSKRELEHWAGNKQLVFAHFFFW